MKRRTASKLSSRYKQAILQLLQQSGGMNKETGVSILDKLAVDRQIGFPENTHLRRMLDLVASAKSTPDKRQSLRQIRRKLKRIRRKTVALAAAKAVGRKPTLRTMLGFLLGLAAFCQSPAGTMTVTQLRADRASRRSTIRKVLKTAAAFFAKTRLTNASETNWEAVPDGFHLSVTDYYQAANLSPDEYTITTDLGGTSLEPFRDPLGLSEAPPTELSISGDERPKQEQGGLVVTLPNARIVTKKGYVIANDNKLIWEFHRDHETPPADHPIFKLPALPPLQVQFPALVSLVNHTSGAYYHWMLDVLPLIHVLRKSGIDIGKVAISGERVEPFEFSTLEMLGIPKENIIVTDEHTHVLANRLIIPRMTYTLRSGWIKDFLNEEFKYRRNIQPDESIRRVYISRETAHYRKVLNEADIMDELSRRGFAKVILEQLPIDEQVRIFSSAEVIVAPHGSGLTNLVFCRPGTKVIELFSSVYVRPFYPELSSVLGHKHYYLIGKKTDDPLTESDNLWMDIGELQRILDLAEV